MDRSRRDLDGNGPGLSPSCDDIALTTVERQACNHLALVPSSLARSHLVLDSLESLPLLLKKEKYAGAINETQKEKEISKRTTNSWSFGLKTFDAHSVREGRSQEKFTKART